jgi:hypothetical protein
LTLLDGGGLGGRRISVELRVQALQHRCRAVRADLGVFSVNRLTVSVCVVIIVII